MMIEASLTHFEEILDDELKKNINTNLKFYHKVFTHLRNPEEIDKKIKDWRKELKEMEDNLYHKIFPVLCK